jgi:hypothetical protein
MSTKPDLPADLPAEIRKQIESAEAARGNLLEHIARLNALSGNIAEHAAAADTAEQEAAAQRAKWQSMLRENNGQMTGPIRTLKTQAAENAALAEELREIAAAAEAEIFNAQCAVHDARKSFESARNGAAIGYATHASIVALTNMLATPEGQSFVVAIGPAIALKAHEVARNPLYAQDFAGKRESFERRILEEKLALLAPLFAAAESAPDDPLLARINARVTRSPAEADPNEVSMATRHARRQRAQAA